MINNATQDFIFGTMATDSLRLGAIQSESRKVLHANRIIPADPEPGQAVTLIVSVGPEINADRVTAYYTTDGSDPAPSTTSAAFTRGNIVWDTLLWGYRQEWSGDIPAQPQGTLVRYCIVASGPNDSEIWADPDPLTHAPAIFAYHVDCDRTPAWVRETVIYHILVDRFEPGAGHSWNTNTTPDGFWGGTLRGVIEKLPYLKSLGVTCLSLSPVFPSPTSYGYDATDYLHVEPRLGTDDDLRALFKAAHEQSMRVLLGYVANHLSNKHPAFEHAISDPEAPERAWFTFSRWPDGYRSFFGVKTMPRIATEHPAARDYLINAANYWLEQGADGFHLDYANGPSHGFWNQFRTATRATKPDSCTLGEAAETAEIQRSYQGRLDGVLDFLLFQQMRAFFAFDTITTSTFDSFLQRHLAYFPSDFILPSFLDSYDTNRFLWIVQGDIRRLKLAALCQFTLPHTPIISYGTEVGLNQRQDVLQADGSRRPEEACVPMCWGTRQNTGLLNFYTQLIALRRQHPQLWSGQRRTLALQDDGLYVVAIENDQEMAIVALNRSPREEHVEIPSEMKLVLSTTSSNPRSNNHLALSPVSGALLLTDRS